jgi:hypothetical protein
LFCVVAVVGWDESRVNTFRRNDLLKGFVEHYTHCPEIEKIVVVWSDQENEPPDMKFFEIAPTDRKRVVFERHSINSLNNRFNGLVESNSDAVFSVDDDLLISCASLRQAYHVWRANKLALVGFSPRMHSINPVTGEPRYHNWQHTWWNGMYSIVLTKAAFFHKKYLKKYMGVMPESMLKHIDQHRNCEDIAMAYLIAKETNAGPVWVKGTVYEMGEVGISSGKDHFLERSNCLQVLADHFQAWPWVVSTQKAEPLGPMDFWQLWRNDGKP